MSYEGIYPTRPISSSDLTFTASTLLGSESARSGKTQLTFQPNICPSSPQANTQVRSNSQATPTSAIPDETKCKNKRVIHRHQERLLRHGPHTRGKIAQIKLL